jgi:hypothetical protein
VNKGRIVNLEVSRSNHPPGKTGGFQIRVIRSSSRSCKTSSGCIATHKHPAVRKWLAKHPRFHIHFTPTSASLLNMVERFFRDITSERLCRGVFTNVPELISAIDEYIGHQNINP